MAKQEAGQNACSPEVDIMLRAWVKALQVKRAAPTHMALADKEVLYARAQT